MQQYLTEKTGKVVLLKDVHNLQAHEDTQKIKPQEELQQLCSWLDEREDLYVQYVTDENQQIQEIYMQDKTMYKIFDAFSEVILVDATHKTSDVRMPLYLIVVVDGNGESQIVASFLVHNEEEHLIREMIRIFKEQNQKWEKVNVALTDKDMVERKVLKSEMPQISLSLCLFHVLRTFKREITMEKMGLTNEERNAALEILQRLTYSTSEEKYNEIYKEVKELELTKDWRNSIYRSEREQPTESNQLSRKSSLSLLHQCLWKNSWRTYGAQ